MRMLVAGVDGYLGCSLAQHRARRGHEVAAADRLMRRSWVDQMGSASAIPTADIGERLAALREHNGQSVPWRGDRRDYRLAERIFRPTHDMVAEVRIMLEDPKDDPPAGVAMLYADVDPVISAATSLVSGHAR